MLSNRLSSLCLTCFLLSSAFGQNRTQPGFEVASVRPADPNQRAVDFVVLQGGRLRATNLTLAELIREAYQIKYYQLEGGPGWLNSDPFNIEAKAAGDPSRKQVMDMLRALLEERFHVKVRHEIREGNVYELAVANRAPKFTPSKAEISFLRLERNTPPELPGVSYTVIAQKVSMTKLADDLMGKVQRPVLDRTGITGEFDFRIDYSIEIIKKSGKF